MRKQLHYITNVDTSASLADCRQCGPSVAVVRRTNPERWACLTARRAQSQRATPRVRTADERRRDNLRQYGITPEQYEALSATQGGTCAICDRPCSSGKRLAVDHCHKTGVVRGLLCRICNQTLGAMQDDPERLLRAVQYLTNRS